MLLLYASCALFVLLLHRNRRRLARGLPHSAFLERLRKDIALEV